MESTNFDSINSQNLSQQISNSNIFKNPFTSQDSNFQPGTFNPNDSSSQFASPEGQAELQSDHQSELHTDSEGDFQAQQKHEMTLQEDGQMEPEIFDQSEEEVIAEDQDVSSKSSRMSSLEFDDEELSGEDARIDDQEEQLQRQNIRRALQQENQDYDDQEQQKKEGEAPVSQARKISLRSFQTTLFQNSRDRNSIIYLPTGTGKTRIAIVSMYYYLCKYGTDKKIVFLANTIQLVKQQAQAIKQTLAEILQDQAFAKNIRQKVKNYIQIDWDQKDLNKHIVCVHGQRNQDQTVTKKKRIENYLASRKSFLTEMKNATITVMISQMFLNCLRRGYIKLTDYSFMVFDECHHTDGDHPYSGVMKEFYFDQKKKNKKLQAQNKLERKDELPIIMGLTASPVFQPYNDPHTLKKELRRLCINLDSNYAPYSQGQHITNNTTIEIQKMTQKSEKQLYPDLIAYFARYNSHSQSYIKIKIHFPDYFKCCQEIIGIMAKQHYTLRIDNEENNITDPQLYLFYDIKESLLVKLRDLWLQLGQFAFTLGYREMILQLKKITGMRNQQNTTLLNDVIIALKKYQKIFYDKYGKCQKAFMSSKVVRLLEILQPTEHQIAENESSDKVNNMVLVFAFKRRTVNYLQLLLQKYKDQMPPQLKKFYQSVGVTGYAVSQKGYRQPDGHSFQSNPSATQQEATLSKHYNRFMQAQREQLSNRLNNQSTTIENKNLSAQMNRMYNAKMGKLLLEIQEKYGNQIKKIIQFKKREHRILITTSVTEEGFDIPSCNLVVSFDTPFSLKSYIQIQGRARKRNSKYIIFTDQNNYKTMLENKKANNNTISAVYELAIHQISKENINALELHHNSPSYEKAATKGGALLNTNYALELLKSYFTSLKQPNRPYIHFIETTNICYRCLIKFPESSTCSINYITGKPHSTKLQAQRSAAFEAIKVLKKEGFIQDDLRSSRLQQLQDELQLQKYNDMGLYAGDAVYRQIMNRYVQIQEFTQQKSQKKLIRFYFQSIEPTQLQFHNLNRQFNQKEFRLAKTKDVFQVYRLKLTNKGRSPLFVENQGINEIGVLTCFERQEAQELFAGFKQKFQPISQEQFQLKMIQSQLRISYEQYQQLKKVHNFLLNSQKNNQIDYYNYLNKSPPVLSPNWLTRQNKKTLIVPDQSRQFFPLMVLLRKQKNNKTYQIDNRANQHILKHIQLFKKIYMYHNKPPKHPYDKHFEQDLRNQYHVLHDTIEASTKTSRGDGRYKKWLVQSINKEMCFHKGYVVGSRENEVALEKYNKEMESREENKKKNKLNYKYQKLKKMYTHFRDSKDITEQQLMKMEIWKVGAKDDLHQFVNKDMKIKKMNDDNGVYRFLKEFILFPVSYPTMLRVSLASKYIFRIIDDYSTALSFRKYFLRNLISQISKNNKKFETYHYNFYTNIVLQSSERLWVFMANAGKSKFLRDLGKACMVKNNSSFSLDGKMMLDMSSINQGLNQSMANNSVNQSNLFNKSQLNRSEIVQRNIEKDQQVKIDVNVLKQLKIDDVLRSLTSKLYKHNKIDNYEEFQFIGDVVLKYLATLQLFLERTSSEQGQMHIARANIICNANLHRAAIKKKLFQYIFTTKKKQEPAPLKKIEKKDAKIKEQSARFQNTEIPILGLNDDDEGYQYIPGKVHADVMEALIGIFYLKSKNLNDCQTLLFAFGILSKPDLQIRFKRDQIYCDSLPPPFADLQARIKYRFKHKGLLIQALTHPTFIKYIQDTVQEDQENSFSNIIDPKLNESKNLSMMSGNNSIQRKHIFKKQEVFYQRFEFLGDAFLDLLVVQYLYDQGGDHLQDQGTLSFLKQSAVSNKTLGFVAMKFQLHEMILMDLDEMDSVLREFRNLNKQFSYLPNPVEFSKLKIGSMKVLGDVFESLIGAILIDNQFSYEATKEVVMNMIEPYIKHFTSFDFVQQCPSYKYKQYLDQNNYKKLKLQKLPEEGIVNGMYMYQFTDNKGNVVGGEIRANNEKEAWDKFFQSKQES